MRKTATRMIADADIQRAAKELVERYGDNAMAAALDIILRDMPALLIAYNVEKKFGISGAKRRKSENENINANGKRE